MKQDCFKVLAVLFTIINQVFFVAIISFSLIITIIVIIIIVFLILILFILFSIYHYIFYQVLLFYYFSVLFFFRLFISYFEFIFVPFSSFIYFFAIFLSLCASNESIKCFICMLLFLILSSLAFVNPPRRTSRSSELSGKLKSLLPLFLCYYRSWAGRFSLYTTCTSPIMHLFCPPKFSITFVFHLSWILQPSQEKLKTMLQRKILGGK